MCSNIVSINLDGGSTLQFNNNENYHLMSIPVFKDNNLKSIYLIYVRYKNFRTTYQLVLDSLQNPIKEYPIEEYKDPLNAILSDIIKLENGEEV